LLAVALASVAVASIGHAGSAAGLSRPDATSQQRTHARHAAPRYAHVFEVVMENLSFDGALATPGFASLAHAYAYASNFYATSHPSLPNYLALTAGQTFGISSDCLTCYVRSDNLGAQLSAAHISWGDFVESVSQPCYLGTSYGEYAAKHNPFRYYDDIRSSPTLCAHLLPIVSLYADLGRGAASTPAYAFVEPNICDDGHDCSPDVAASWLSGFVATVTRSAAWRDHGLLVVTWDESEGDDSRLLPSGQVVASGGGGHILTIVIAAGAKAGTVITTPLTHDALLATVERNFGLPLLAGAAAWRDRTLSIG